MALILCLETSSKNCSVAISKNGQIIFSKDQFDQNYCHGEQLHVLIQDLLVESQFLIKDFDAFAFSCGPGSYTGLRIGAASVKGLSFVLDKPIIAVCTLNAMLFGTIGNPKVDKHNYDLFCPVLDSRIGEVYIAIYDNHNNQILAPTACDIASFSFSKYFKNSQLCFFGPGTYKLESALKHKNITFLHNEYPSAKFLGKLVEAKHQNKNFVDSAYFEPMYLKPFIPTTSKKKQHN